AAPFRQPAHTCMQPPTTDNRQPLTAASEASAITCTAHSLCATFLRQLWEGMMVSVRRVAPVLLLVMALPVFGAKKSSSQPPRDLHRVGDHWTAYNPPDPSTYPAGAKTYEIKAGDTLWALAQQFYGNAYLWPQLWESNTWITDA